MKLNHSWVLVSQGTMQCWIDLGSPTQWRIYMSLVSFSLFIAPTLIIGGCYMVIVATIWSQGGALRQGPTRDTRRASSRGLIPRAKIKTVKMTFVIVFGKTDRADIVSWRRRRLFRAKQLVRKYTLAPLGRAEAIAPESLPWVLFFPLFSFVFLFNSIAPSRDSFLKGARFFRESPCSRIYISFFGFAKLYFNVWRMILS